MNIKDGASTFEVVYHKATFKGMIMPFSGSFDSDGYPIDGSTNIVRKDWHICDGTNGTPDLRGRFILGANSGHAVGSTGGEETHTLSVNEMPSHGHMVRTWNRVESGRAQVFRDGSWVDSGQDSYYHITGGEWATNANDAPQYGLGDPAGTTDGTGGAGSQQYASVLFPQLYHANLKSHIKAPMSFPRFARRWHK